MNIMRLNISDYRADTLHLTHTEHGIYLSLLMWHYDSEKPIPNDISQVARKLRLNQDEVEIAKELLKEYFLQGTNGYLNARTQLELHNVEYRKAVNKVNGSKGGRPRKANGKQTITETKANEKQNETEIYPNRFIPATVAEKISCPVQEIVELYHQVLPELRQCLVINDQRRKFITARWKELVVAGEISSKSDGLEFFKVYFESVKKSSFLCGKNDTGWQADLEWIVRPTNWAKVIEGKFK